MITFVASYAHTYTFAALRGPVLGPSAPETEAITYDDLFAAEALPTGTYVFTDMERLHPAELRLAARFYRRLRDMPGFRVLNDPARVRTRYGLLRTLAEAGLNDFDAYCASGLPRPRRLPVFLRIASDHAGPIGDLIHDQRELEKRLNGLQDEGVPLTGVLVVEFCGERNADGLYEKFAFLRIGERATLSALLLGNHWNVKTVGDGLALLTPAVMRDQLEAIRQEKYAEQMRAAFDLAGIDYGRADVGLCNGRLQVYEINTNPNISASNSFLSEDHKESRLIFRSRFSAMLHAIDTERKGRGVPVRLGKLDVPSRNRRAIAKTIIDGRKPDEAVRPRVLVSSPFKALGDVLRRYGRIARRAVLGS